MLDWTAFLFLIFVLFFSLQRGAFVSEPAILVRRVNSGSQVWSMEKLENKLIDMRDMYQEYKERRMLGLVSVMCEMRHCSYLNAVELTLDDIIIIHTINTIFKTISTN